MHSDYLCNTFIF